MSITLDGLVTFFASHHAIRAEKVLDTAGFEVELIPGPKELSPNCGVALRVPYRDRSAIADRLRAESVEVDQVLEYVPRTDEWTRERPPSRPRRRLFNRRRR